MRAANLLQYLSRCERRTFYNWMTDQLIEAIEKSIFVDGIPQWDDLLGLYFGEYRRRSQGVDAVLYKNQPEKFREKFGEYMDSKVEHDREGYLRRLLIDIVQNRKKIPVIIVDNTDEFDLELRKAIFQYAQALRRHAKHCIVIQPVTDKSAWSFSKTDIFGIPLMHMAPVARVCHQMLRLRLGRGNG